MTTLLFGVLVVLLSVLVALAGLVLVQRLLIPLTIPESHNEITAAIHQTIALVYGVAIGFTIILVWQQLDTAQATTEREASNVEAIYRLASKLPESNRNQLQEQARLYAEVVVQEEWPLLAQEQASAHAQNTVDELRGSIEEFEPKTVAEQNIATRMLTNIDALDENRGLRLLSSKEGIPPLLWIFLVIGAILTVASTYVFGKQSPRLHMVRVAMLAAIVALSLYTVHALEHPFVGEVQVGTDAFQSVLDRIDSNAEK